MHDMQRVGLAQIAPAWLERRASQAKMCGQVAGRPMRAPPQKRLFAHIVSEAVQIHLQPLQNDAPLGNIWAALGLI